jgi:hypothetical protein
MDEPNAKPSLSLSHYSGQTQIILLSTQLLKFQPATMIKRTLTPYPFTAVEPRYYEVF